jgi:hypothetical protein
MAVKWAEMEQGSWIDREGNSISAGFTTNLNGYRVLYMTISRMILKLISVINCQNVELVDVHPSKKQQRSRRKKKRQPLNSYKILSLKGKKIVDSKGGASSSLKRLHLCRGHFKTFTEDKPLMGRHTGTYWWQPQARGSKDKGKVEKSYQLEA